MLALGGRGHLSCVGELRARSRSPSSTTRSSPATTSARAQLHYELHALVDAAFAETNPVPAKWIMRELGLLNSDHAREPLAPLSEAWRRRSGR